jgi:hypothetical protein
VKRLQSLQLYFQCSFEYSVVYRGHSCVLAVYHANHVVACVIADLGKLAMHVVWSMSLTLLFFSALHSWWDAIDLVCF